MVSDEHFAALDKLSRKTGMSVAEYVRRAITNALKRDKDQKAA